MPIFKALIKTNKTNGHIHALKINEKQRTGYAEISDKDSNVTKLFWDQDLNKWISLSNNQEVENL